MKKNVNKTIEKQKLSFADGIQKTWIPEGTEEYSLFKLVTQENQKLVETIKRHVPLKPGDLVLDVGGRDGNVAFDVQTPKYVHIVDPDPTISLQNEPGKFWNEKIQNIDFNPKIKYKLIICCHVLGYLGLQDVQKEVVSKLVTLLDNDGVLVLFYNTNIGYMRELLDYSKHVLPAGHFDYFEESTLGRYRMPGYEIKRLDVSFALNYPTYNDLARCCWFLFGAIDPNINEKADRFLIKLKNDLIEPTFTIDERMTFLFKRSEKLLFPTIK